MMKTLLFAGTSALLLAVAPAKAALNVPVPTNAYISFGGADWAWASPCSPTGCYNGGNPLDLSYQATQGWRLPTTAEMLAAPSYTAFAFAGANVPFGGSDANGTFFTGSVPRDAACATAYFTSPNTFNQCNWDDAAINAIFNLYSDPNERNVETWVIRGTLDGGVPEPTTWAMLIAGFGLTGAAMRRRRSAAVAA